VRPLILALSLFLITTSVHCQETKRGSSLLSFSIGPNFSNFLDSKAPYHSGTSFLDGYDYNTSIINDVRIGLNLGVGYEYFLRDGLSVRFAFGFENKGMNLLNKLEKNLNSGIASYSYQIKVDNDYLVMPLLVKKHFRNTGFYIQGGAYLALILRSQAQISFERRIVGSSLSYSYINFLDRKMVHTSDFDFGFSCGAGYKHNLTSRLLFNIDFLLSAGIIKNDKLYNNEHMYIAGGTNNSVLIETNYYGLSSDARNISANLSFGLLYRLNLKDQKTLQ